ncbi:hypothetical protein K2173_018565 [Erythroxylum novogranatense]|uniref:Succinate dehydrogenase assembly factor 4, mitochondrial n=1 Tax=Erythroxylum novogranatense TaxID=1862640 RepID=A0AAV8UFK2_9ROSI|nr:hypothetical protein K2173_018565 [Erythroxylum novogranatense]
MARNNLCRLFSSLPKFPRTRSAILTGSNSASTRLLSSSTQLQEETLKKQQLEKDSLNRNPQVETGEKRNEEEEENEEDLVNIETGEVGGPRGPEPTRYGDWERNGRCSDF